MSNTQKPFSMKYNIPEKFRAQNGLIFEALKKFLTESRIEKMQRVVQNRSRHVATIFENTHHAHNTSAILRNLDSFGFLDLFFLYSQENMRFRTADAIDRGASQWLSPKRVNSFESCVRILKENGFKIALVSLPDFSRTSTYYSHELPSFSSNEFTSPKFIDTLQDQKIALVFGSELHGISREWHAVADLYVHVNMSGFCESLNVSVCAGIILNALRVFLENHIPSFLLSKHDQTILLEHWISKDYVHARQYITREHPHLLDWLDFIQTGKYYAP